MKRKKHAEHENMERWLVSYADFITLLFAFFVVMYSTSSINEGKLRAVADSVNSAFHPYIALSASSIRLSQQTSGTEMFDTGFNLYQRLRNAVEKMNVEGKISVDRDRRGIIIRVSDTFAFETAKADILPDFADKLDKISEMIRPLSNGVQIEGHTDNVPINTPVYPSNWELSTARATIIMRYFVEHHHLPAQRFSVVGYGQFRPIASNENPEGRARNRRVEIVILNLGPSTLGVLSEVPVTELPSPSEH